MKRAAVYARRSTDEHQAASLDVQLEEARRCVEKKGWVLSDEHIYLEDAVSRAEFKKRPALIAMLNAASEKAFDIVVTRDETRLGGDVNRTGLLIQDLLDHGVELFYYFTDEKVTLDDALQKFLVAARNFAAELEREKISARTREHLHVKARRGLNAGGRCFGYDNVRVDSATEYRINESEAAVVRRMFELFIEGRGFKGIAKALNDKRVPPPRVGKRGIGTWSPSVVRSMLLNERYTGVLKWGRFKKAYRGGTKVRLRQADCDVLRVARRSKPSSARRYAYAPSSTTSSPPWPT
jgi:site-specific DNA recombinase